MRTLLFGLVVAIGFAPQVSGQAQAPAGPKVQLTFEAGGTVSLVANGATLREILDEWSRKGGTPFVGADRLSGGPLTLQYDHRPETEVVGSLLRNASGVIIAPRREDSVGVSQIGAVFILATSTATAATGYSTPTYNAPPPQISSPGSPDQEVAPIGPGRAGQPPTQQQAPPPAPAPPARPAGVSGVAVQVVPVTVPVATAPPPTAPPTTTTGRGGGGGGGGR